MVSDSENKPKEKHSKLASFAIAFALSGVLAPVGLVIGIVDVFILRQHKKGLSLAAVLLSALWIVVGTEAIFYFFPAAPGTITGGIAESFAGNRNGSEKEDETPSVYTDNSGEILRIYSYNDNLRLYTEQYYPDYVKIDDSTGMIGDTEVQWTTVSKDEGYYENCISDEVLSANFESEEPIDIFVTDSAWSRWYSSLECTVPLKDIGLDSQTFSDIWPFTADLASDENGSLKAATYNADVCAMLYNRRIAKAIFGTDDREIVQANVNDLDICYNLSAILTKQGYRMCVSPQELFYVYCQNSEDRIVTDGKVSVYDDLIEWTIDSKNMIDWDCALNTDVGSLQWAEGFSPYSNTFSYILPLSMLDTDIEGYGPALLSQTGEWGICMGPGACCFPGTGDFLFVPEGNDNSSLTAEFIKTVTTDLNFLDHLADDGVFVNSRTIMKEKASSSNISDDRFLGQNPYVPYCQNAERLRLRNITQYDYRITECYKEEMWAYFGGFMSLNEALNKFRQRVDYQYGLN